MFWSVWLQYSTHFGGETGAGKKYRKFHVGKKTSTSWRIYTCVRQPQKNYTASSQICMVASETMSRATDGEFHTLELANVNIHVNFRPYLPKNLTFLCLEREILTNTQNQVHICVFSKIQIKFRPQTRQEWYCKQFVMFFMVLNLIFQAAITQRCQTKLFCRIIW